MCAHPIQKEKIILYFDERIEKVPYFVNYFKLQFVMTVIAYDSLIKDR